MSSPSKRSEKISVSVGVVALRRAKLLAKHSGVSLSRIVTEAIELFAAEEERRAIARDLVESFPDEARATKAEKDALLKQWSTPHERAASKRQRRAG